MSIDIEEQKKNFLNLLRIAYRAKRDEKRQLISLVFDNLQIDEGKLNFCYTKAFEILSGAVKATNSSKVSNLAKLPAKIFEPQFSSKKRAKKPESAPLLWG